MDRVITVIPVYNGERFLRATLESVARQTVRPDRLIVIDDCSTDGTRDLVRGFQEFPCELRQNATRQGLFGNLNCALDLAAEAEHLHILLADDLILPRFFERLLPALEGASGRALAYSLTESIDQHGARLESARTGANLGEDRAISLREFVTRQCELQTVLCGSILLKTGGQPSPVRFRLDMPQTGDCVFYAEWAALCSQRIEVREALCQIRHHPFSATNQNIKRIDSWVLDEWKAIDAISQRLADPLGLRWLRRQKLKCLFAARSHVKIAMTRQSAPEFAREIRERTLSIVRPHHWFLGGLAVGVRDALRRPDTATRASQNEGNK